MGKFLSKGLLPKKHDKLKGESKAAARKEAKAKADRAAAEARSAASTEAHAKEGTRMLTSKRPAGKSTVTSIYQDPSVYQLGKMAPQLTRPEYSRYFTETVTPSGTEVKALYDRRKIAAALNPEKTSRIKWTARPTDISGFLSPAPSWPTSG